MDIRTLPRDHRGRVRIFEICSSKVIERQPVDALEGLQRGLFRFATAEELASLPPQTQAVNQPITVDPKAEEPKKLAPNGPGKENEKVKV